MAKYSNSISNHVNLINRIIYYFKSNKDKAIIQTEIINDNDISYKSVKIILAFLITQKVIIKVNSNSNTVKYYYNSNMNKL